MNDYWYRRLYVYIIFWPLILVFFAFASGCVRENAMVPRDDGSSALNIGGGEVSAIHLPTRPGQSALCTQGPRGTHSHNVFSTLSDIDLDTANNRDEAIYAPSAGIVYVFDVDAHRGFGFHVNIDLGDGTYVVLGHFAIIAVQNGAELAVGQFLGYEGCTGNCTGDHIHIGLHRGDASRPAQFGESIPATYLVADPSAQSGSVLLGSGQFRCGIRAAGDAIDGDRYSSVLKPVLFHPDGTLVKTLGSPKVYRLEGGQARWIENEAVFRSLRLSFDDVVFVSDQELSCYAQGRPISEESLVDAVRDASGTVWLIVGARGALDRYRSPIDERSMQTILASWGITVDRNALAQVDVRNDYLVNWPARNTLTPLRDGSLVKERGRPDVFVIANGVPMPVRDWRTYLILGFEPRSILEVDPGDLLFLHGALGDCRLMTSCLSHETVSMCGGQLDRGQEASPQPAQFAVATVNDQNVVPVASDPDAGIEPDPQPSDEPNAQPPSNTDATLPLPNGESEGDRSSDASPVIAPDAGVAPSPDPDASVPVEVIVEHDGNDDPPEHEVIDPEPEVIDPEPENNLLFELCDDLACIIDADQDGRMETLVMADDIWIRQELETLDAYIYGNGGCFDSVLTRRDLVVSQNDYYFIDFSRFQSPCSVQLSLISSITTDGQPTSPDRSNWSWWQNAEFCRDASPLCELMRNGNPWEEWLLSVAWDPLRGLMPNGNGFTLNAQL